MKIDMRPGATNRVEPSRSLTKERWKAIYRRKRVLLREPFVESVIIDGEDIYLVPDTGAPATGLPARLQENAAP